MCAHTAPPRATAPASAGQSQAAPQATMPKALPAAATTQKTQKPAEPPPPPRRDPTYFPATKAPGDLYR